MPIQNQSCFTSRERPEKPASRGRVSRLRSSEMGGAGEEYIYAECPLSCLFRATEPRQDGNIWGSVRMTSLGG